MYNNNNNGGRTASARGLMALWAVLAMALALSARPAAAPFAFIANGTTSTVSVIDTASNTVVATILVGSDTIGVAVPQMENTYTSRVMAPTMSR